MILVRFPLAEEENAFIELARLAVEESYPHKLFNPERVRETYRNYLKTAHPTFFVAVDRGRLIGFVQATISGYDFADGIYTTLCATFIHPDKRGTRAAALLLQAFTRWSDRLEADESTGGNDNSLTTERTTRLLGRFGFEPVGTFVRRKRGG